MAIFMYACNLNVHRQKQPNYLHLFMSDQSFGASTTKTTWSVRFIEPVDWRRVSRAGTGRLGNKRVHELLRYKN